MLKTIVPFLAFPKTLWGIAYVIRAIVVLVYTQLFKDPNTSHLRRIPGSSFSKAKDVTFCVVLLSSLVVQTIFRNFILEKVTYHSSTIHSTWGLSSQIKNCQFCTNTIYKVVKYSN